ncbi:MAG: MFS transporter, partial [Solirubrobacteraceae bacterium]
MSRREVSVPSPHEGSVPSPREVSVPSHHEGSVPAIALVRVLLLFEASLYAAVTPILPHYAQTLGVSKPAVGVLAAAYSAGVIPGSLLGGWLAARIGVRRTTLFGLIVFAGAVGAFGFAGDLVTLDVLRVIQGIACGSIWAGALTWAIAVAPRERRGAVVGSVIGAAIFGTLLGPVLGVFAVTVGTAPVFSGVGAISLGLAFWVRRHPEPTVPEAEAKPARAPLATLLRSPGLRLGTWLVVLEAMTIGATSALLPLRLSRLGASGLAIGATFLLVSALSAALAPLVGRTTDRHGAARPMTIGLLGSALLIALLPVPHSWPVTAALSVIVLGGPLTGLMIPAVSLMTESAERAGLAIVLVTTIVNLGYAVGETIGAPAAASLSTATSDAVPLLGLSVAMLLSLRWVRSTRRAAAPPPATGATPES